MRVFTSLRVVAGACGEVLGTSNWMRIDQKRIDRFAEATGDYQWIHVDPVRAAKGPFGSTIAHGYLTLSLLPLLASEIYRFDTPGPRLNYGIEKVRFPSALLVDQRVRVTVRLADAVTVEGGLRVSLANEVAVEGSAKPACVAETLVLLLN